MVPVSRVTPVFCAFCALTLGNPLFSTCSDGSLSQRVDYMGPWTTVVLHKLDHNIACNQICTLTSGNQARTIHQRPMKSLALKNQSEHPSSMFEQALTANGARISLEQIMSKGVANAEAGSSINHTKEYESQGHVYILDANLYFAARS